MSPIIVKSENLKPFKNYVIKTIFTSDTTNFLIELT